VLIKIKQLETTWIMIKLYAYFKKLASVKNIILFFVLSLLVNLLFAKSHGILEFGIPDTHLHYTAEEFYALFEKYTQKEINIYIKGMLLLDFIYPVFYSLFLALFIFRLSHKTLQSLLPFGVLIFDYIENMSVFTLIRLMPSRHMDLATFAGYFTLTKWILTSLCLIIVLVYMVRYFVKLKFGRNE